MLVESHRATVEKTPLFSSAELFEKARDIGHLPSPSDLASIADQLQTDVTFESIEPSTLVALFEVYPHIFEGKSPSDIRELLRYANTRCFADFRLRYEVARKTPELASSILPDLLYTMLEDSHLLDQMISATQEGFTYQPLSL